MHAAHLNETTKTERLRAQYLQTYNVYHYYHYHIIVIISSFPIRFYFVRIVSTKTLLLLYYFIITSSRDISLHLNINNTIYVVHVLMAAATSNTECGIS